MYQTITIYTIASNIVLTEMIGRHAVVIVRHFMLFLNNICIIHNIYTFSKNDQLKSIYLKPLYRMMIVLKFRTVHPLSAVFVVNGMPCFQLEIITVQSLMGHNIPFGGIRTHK